MASLRILVNWALCLLLCISASADYFMVPGSFEYNPAGEVTTVNDLSTNFKIGDKVQLTWNTNVTWISVKLILWGEDNSVTVTSFLSMFPLEPSPPRCFRHDLRSR
jgi:hypothetical protein